MTQAFVDDTENTDPLRAEDIRGILNDLGYRPPGGVRQNQHEIWFWSTSAKVTEHYNALSQRWPEYAVESEEIRSNRWTVAIQRRPRKAPPAARRQRHIDGYLMPVT